MGQCAKVTGDNLFPKAMEVKGKIRSWTHYVLICILFASLKSVHAVTQYSIDEGMEESSGH
jgi:hypothetical protein